MICCNLKHILEPAHSYEFLKKTHSVNKSWHEKCLQINHIYMERGDTQKSAW